MQKTTKSCWLSQRFADPPAEYGLYPCWWWEGQTVTKERLTWQLEQMKQVGTCATWFYQRYTRNEPFAIDPPCGSEAFLELFRHSLHEHRRLGMHAYFSEWTARYPLETLLGDDLIDRANLRGRRLLLHENISRQAEQIHVDVPIDQEVLSAAAYRATDCGVEYDSRHVLDFHAEQRRCTWDAPGADWRLAVITSQTYRLDYLNPELADHWIQMLWGSYLRNFSEYVGNTLRGYIQDELLPLDGNLIYSRILLQTFLDEKGYDPRPWLIALFHDIGPQTEKVRCDYYDVMSHLLEDNLYRRFADWHEKNHLEFCTIAVGCRSDILAQTNHYGDLFRLLRHYHLPGNEDPQLNDQVPVRRRFIDAKLSSSAAHLFQRKRAGLCASWGSGWGSTLEQNLAWANENFAYGINLYDPHSAYYSLAGGWYEWVPPAQYFYQPYWRHYKYFADYIRRVSFMMSQGVHVADAAVLFPTTSIHANWLRGNRFTPAADVTAAMTYNIANRLYTDNIDFDFVDEDTLREAQVRDRVLCISGMAFRAVVLPPMTTIRIETLRKLKTFFDHGGVVVACQQLPFASAERGREDPEIRSLLTDLFGISSSDTYHHVTFVPRPISGQIHENHFRDSVLIRTNNRGGRAIFMPAEQDIGTNGMLPTAVNLPTIIAEFMTRDVRPPSPQDAWRSDGGHIVPPVDVFHTHQRVDGDDIYFLFNARAQTRQVTLSFRVIGEPELWNAFTGEVKPYHRFEKQSESTTLRLPMRPHEGVIVRFSAPTGRPSIIADNLTDIIAIAPCPDGFAVEGVCDSGGRKTVVVSCMGATYHAESRFDEPPSSIPLTGEWAFGLIPTMDNRWGDYRHPASTALLGSEARRFKYTEEQELSGERRGWHTTEFDDSIWASHTYSFGPYWHVLGPLDAGHDARELLDRFDRGRDIHCDVVEDRTNSRVGWERYEYSQLFGHASTDLHSGFGGIQGVSDYFLIFPRLSIGQDATRYLVTSVYAPQDGEWDFIIGGLGQFARQAWINGQQVLSYQAEDTDRTIAVDEHRLLCPLPLDTKPTEQRAEIHLRQGRNTVLLRLVHPRGDAIWAFAAIVPMGANPTSGQPPIPRLRWFVEPTDLLYDIKSDDDRRIGWYRFEAPPGMRAMTLHCNARNIHAWIDGQAVSVCNGKVTLVEPKQRVSKVALRLEQHPGCYAGAAMREPVSFECETGAMPLGDWCNHALECYSGGAVYSKEFDLDARHLENRIIVDLGRVRTTSEVKVNGIDVGVRVTQPHRYDITNHAKVGCNRIEVTVYNTLANHYSIGFPSTHVFEGQTVSGLLGPASIGFLKKVKLIVHTQSVVLDPAGY